MIGNAAAVGGVPGNLAALARQYRENGETAVFVAVDGAAGACSASPIPSRRPRPRLSNFSRERASGW